MGTSDDTQFAALTMLSFHLNDGFDPEHLAESFCVFPEGDTLVMDIFFEDLSYTESSMEEAEVLDWYKMSPAERFVESQKLWEVFLLFGQWGHWPMGSNLSS